MFLEESNINFSDTNADLNISEYSDTILPFHSNDQDTQPTHYLVKERKVKLIHRQISQ